MISTSKKTVLVWRLTLCLTLAVFSGLVQAQEYSEHQLHIFNEITKGVKSLGEEDWRFAAIAPVRNNKNYCYTGRVICYYIAKW